MRRAIVLAIAGMSVVGCTGRGADSVSFPDPDTVIDADADAVDTAQPEQDAVPGPNQGQDLEPGLDIGPDAEAVLSDPDRDDAENEALEDSSEADPGLDLPLDSPSEPGPADSGVPPADLLPQDPGSPPGSCPYGTWESPCPVLSLPATLTADTSLSVTSAALAYAPCAPGIPEAGPEVVFALTILQDGILHLALDDVPGDEIDNDIHLLSGTGADSCVARDNIALTRPVLAGEAYRIAVDSWSGGGQPRPGPFVLSIWLVPTQTGKCPADMQPVGEICMDRYEAPNVEGGLPLVMYSFVEAATWCEARGKRLCFDDEWTAACEGSAKTAYPYGSAHVPGICHDEAKWLQYNQSLLDGWPWSVSGPDIASLDALLAAASAVSAKAKAAADHVKALYQGAPSGLYTGCVNEFGVFDLVGNVEEWTRRRDGGKPQFHGNLKGRYWAETRTCQQGVTTHGDGFRFYEIGFRCCLDP